MTEIKKSVLFILPNLNGGGAERVAITYLRQMDYEKYDVSLAVFNTTNDLLEFLPPKVNLIDIKSVNTYKSFLPLLKLIRRLRPDIVYTSHSRVAALLMLIKPFTPVFWHAARLQSMPSLEKKNRAYGFMRRAFYAIGFRSADAVAAETHEMMEDAIKVFKLSRNRMQVLNNPIDKEYIKKEINAKGNPFTGNIIVAVASGRIATEKGFDVLLKALPKVIDEHDNFRLSILGSHSNAKDDVLALIDDLKLAEHVVLEGFQKNPYRYYAYCDLFILSSRWEGFPNAFIENYYLNTPIVSTRCVPVVEQLIQEGDNGYLCEVNDVDGMSQAILDCIRLKRSSISNHYDGAKLETIFSDQQAPTN